MQNKIHHKQLHDSNDMINPSQFNESFSSNILIENPSSQNDQYLTLYIPAYIRLQLLRFEELSVPQQKAILATIVQFDVDITNLPKQIVEVIKANMKWHMLYQNGAIWDFNNEDDDNHDKVQPKCQYKIQNKTLLKYKFFNNFQSSVITNIIWTPFEMLTTLTSIKVQEILVSTKEANQKNLFKSLQSKNNNSLQLNGQNKGLAIRFNLMDYRYDLQRRDHQSGRLVGDMAQVVYGHDVQIGYYELAERQIKIKYSNSMYPDLQIQRGKAIVDDLEQSCWVKLFQWNTNNPRNKPIRKVSQEDQKESQKQRLKRNFDESFCNAHFSIPLGRRPLVSTFQLMVPGYILGLISLVIFFQSTGQDGLANKVSAIATIILAYIAFQPTIRSSIPAQPKLSIIQFVLYSQILITVLCLVDAFISAVNEEYVFEWFTNPFFLISLIIQGFATLIFMGAIGTYYFKWIGSYSLRTGIRIAFKPSQWNNPQCDTWFYENLIKNYKRNIRIY